MRRFHLSSIVPALLLLSQASQSLAAPGLVYSVGAPPPQYKNVSGEAVFPGTEVARDGEALHRISLQVPMGRNGAQPTVNLVYGSRTPVRGGIAAGWSLPLSSIRLDTSKGRAQGKHYTADGAKLVPIDEPNIGPGRTAYRAEGDASYARYERVDDGSENGHWIVRGLDGSVRYYGSSPNSKDSRTEGSPNSTLYGAEYRWMLSESRDSRGNQVVYNYDLVFGAARNGALANTPVDIVLRSIEYGRNVNDPSTEHHAKIDFIWQSNLDTCPGSSVPIGAKFDYRSGIRRYEGARKLLAIRASIKDSPGKSFVLRRELTLNYDNTAEVCGELASPRRILSGVIEKAWAPDGTLLTLPEQTFEYASREISYAGSQMDPNALPNGLSFGKDPLNKTKAGGWPTTDGLLLDLDGNGSPEPTTSAALCPKLPKQPWADGQAPADASSLPLDEREGCSLTAQVTHRETHRIGPAPHVARPPGEPPPPATQTTGFKAGEATTFNGYRFMDVNNDGLPDLVTALFYQKGAYRPTEDNKITSQGIVADDYPACTEMPSPQCQLANGIAVPCLISRYRQAVLPLDSGWSGYSANASLGTSPLGDCTGTMYEAEGHIANLEEPTTTEFGPGSDLAIALLRERYSAVPTYNTDGRADAFAHSQDLFPLSGTPSAVLHAVQEAVVVENQNTYTGYVPDMHCGYYPLRVYRNSGRPGQFFRGEPQLVFSPIPLETDQLVSGLGAGPTANISAYRGIFDLDGDGRPDAVYQRPPWTHGPADTDHRNFQVWFGENSGAFASSAGGTSWNTPTTANGTRPVLQKQKELLGNPWTGDRPHERSREEVALRDVNGDGLLDYVRTAVPNQPPGLFVYYNTGLGFESNPTRLSNTATSFSETVRVNPKSRVNAQWVNNPQGFPEAYTVATSQATDLDADGLEDVVLASPPPAGAFNPFSSTIGATMTGFVNVGDALVQGSSPRWGAALADRRKALLSTSMNSEHTWRSVAGIVDLNRDGLPDLVEPIDLEACPNGPAESYNYINCPYNSGVRHAASRPLGLLTAINSGVGARIEYTYASSSDESTVRISDGYRLKTPLWVVKSRTIKSGTAGEAAQITEYEYSNPVSNFDRFGEHAFRGFETITVTGPTGLTARRKRTRDTYNFEQDKHGLLARTLTTEVFVAQNNREELVSYTDHTYQRLRSFGAAVETFAQTDVRTVLCSQRPVGYTSTAIEACNADHTLDRTSKNWIPLGSPVLAWGLGQTRHTTSTSPTPVAGDLLSIPTYELRHSAEEYSLLNTVAETKDGNGTLLGRVTVDFEPGPRALALATYAFQDENTIATTRYTYSAIGNLETTTRPNQVAQEQSDPPGIPLVTTVSYDEFGLYPAQTANEYDQKTSRKLDLATGALEQETAIPQAGVTPVLQHQIDGLGRVVKTSRTVEISPGVFEQRLVATNEYVDIAPRTVTQRALKSEDSWVLNKTWLDGLGRVSREEAPSASGTRMIRRSFDGAGNASIVFTTNPASATGAEVSHIILHDGFNRQLSVLNPDTTRHYTAFMGKWTFDYDYPNDGTPSDYRLTEADGRGRIVRVIEGYPSRTNTYYSYDALDRVTRIVDADNVVTTITYDLAGNRKSVTRAGSTISYDYDLHGNRTRALHPTENGIPDEIHFASHWTYDALDRISTATPAVRNLDNDDLVTLFGGDDSKNRTTTYSYDDPSQHNGIGRLTGVQAPHGATQYGYNLEGLVDTEERLFQVSPEGTTIATGGKETHTFDLMGNRIHSTHANAFSSGDTTQTSAQFDDRGRPQIATVTVPGLGEKTVAEFVRNPAGLVTRRNSAIAEAYQLFSYDGSGRILSNEIRGTWCASGCMPGVIAGESFSYFPIGLPKSMTDLAKNRTFDFGYNDHLELTSAATRNSSAYVGVFSYTPSGKVASVNLSSQFPGVFQRNVTHNYTPETPDRVDPAAVRSLRSAADGSLVGSFGYDPSGNLKTKTVGTSDMTFTYDGNDQLRRAVNNSTGEVEIYWYDHTGNRVLTYRPERAGTPSSLRHRFGTTEIFVNKDSSVQRTTLDVHLGGQVVARVTNGDESRLEYTFNGALGSLLAAVDESGKGTARYGYGPFGELLYTEGASAGQYDRGYEAKARDAATGLSYFGHRYYDPMTLSWTQADPLYRLIPERAGADPRRMSPYTYVLNNPLHLVDPDGLDGKKKEVDVKKTTVQNITTTNERETRKLIEKQVEKQLAKACGGDEVCIAIAPLVLSKAIDIAMSQLIATEGTLEKPGIPDRPEPMITKIVPGKTMGPFGDMTPRWMAGAMIQTISGGCKVDENLSSGGVVNSKETSDTIGSSVKIGVSAKDGPSGEYQLNYEHQNTRGTTVNLSVYSSKVSDAKLAGLITTMVGTKLVSFEYEVPVNATLREPVPTEVCTPGR